MCKSKWNWQQYLSNFITWTNWIGCLRKYGHYGTSSYTIINFWNKVLAEITLKLENMWFRDSEQSFGRGDNMILNTKRPKLEFPVFVENPLNESLFMTTLTFRFTKTKSSTILINIIIWEGIWRDKLGQILVTWNLLRKNYKEALDILIDRYGNPQV